MAIIFSGLAGFFLLYWIIKSGPLSQRHLVKKHEAHNLRALQSAKLQTLDAFPDSDITYLEPWRKVPGFIPPWTSPLPFSFGLSNGPLEGASFDGNYAVIVGDVTLVMTHRWVNGKNWGLAYNPHQRTIPTPYWSKHLVDDWYVWYFGGDGHPEKAGMWYE